VAKLILTADDAPFYLAALRKLLEREPDYNLCEQAPSRPGRECYQVHSGQGVDNVS
jgi:hypothetical protein